MKRVLGALAGLVAACALIVPAASSAAGPVAATGGGRGTVDGVHAFSDFGFSVMRSTDGSVAGHFNCLMAGSSQFPGFTLMAVRGQVTSGTIGAPVNDGKYAESSTVSFTAVSANDLVQVTLAEQTGSPTYATIVSCTTKANGTQIKNIVWNKPWTAP